MRHKPKEITEKIKSDAEKLKGKKCTGTALPVPVSGFHGMLQRTQ